MHDIYIFLDLFFCPSAGEGGGRGGEPMHFFFCCYLGKVFLAGIRKSKSNYHGKSSNPRP